MSVSSIEHAGDNSNIRCNICIAIFLKGKINL